MSPETYDEDSKKAAADGSPLSFTSMEEKLSKEKEMQKLVESEIFRAAVKKVMQEEKEGAKSWTGDLHHDTTTLCRDFDDSTQLESHFTEKSKNCVIRRCIDQEKCAFIIQNLQHR